MVMIDNRRDLRTIFIYSSSSNFADDKWGKHDCIANRCRCSKSKWQKVTIKYRLKRYYYKYYKVNGLTLISDLISGAVLKSKHSRELSGASKWMKKVIVRTSHIPRVVIIRLSSRHSRREAAGVLGARRTHLPKDFRRRRPQRPRVIVGRAHHARKVV